MLKCTWDSESNSLLEQERVDILFEIILGSCFFMICGWFDIDIQDWIIVFSIQSVCAVLQVEI